MACFGGKSINQFDRCFVAIDNLFKTFIKLTKLAKIEIWGHGGFGKYFFRPTHSYTFKCPDLNKEYENEAT